MTPDESRDGASVRIPPPLFPLATILLGVALQRWWPIPLELPAPARYWVGGIIVAAAVLGLGLRAVILFRRTGQSEIPWKPTPEMVFDGPFRLSRNPMYLQMVIVCLGVFVILANAWILILTPVCALLLQHFAILPEEAYLERKFGEDYLRYKRSVRRWV